MNVKFALVKCNNLAKQGRNQNLLTGGKAEPGGKCKIKVYL